MFDGSLAEIADFAGLDDAALADQATGWARVEAAAAARKLAVMAELFMRRTDTADAQDRELWWVDPCAAVGAELAAAQGISTWNALDQARAGVALRDRLPEVATLFAAGLVDARIATSIVWSTHLIQDPDAMAAVDAELAARITRWGAWSSKKITREIDALVIKHDPGALRRGKAASRARYVDFGSPTDEPGTTSMYGRLLAHHGELIDSVLDEMAKSVCPNDPRTLDERRSDAMGALGARTELACLCGLDDCTAGQSPAPARNLVVHVVADAATVEAAQATQDDSAPAPAAQPSTDTADPAPQTDTAAQADQDDQDDQDDSAPAPAVPPTTDSIRDATVTEAPPPPTDDEAPAPPVPPAFVIGQGVLPVHALAEVLPYAVLRTVTHPGDAPPEPGYVPSCALADFVRCRDMTCRFPGCDKPADRCDLDHTVPYPHGCTHASNLKCLCRFHHILKTFWVGEGGWSDRQLPDGTVIWTAPTGHEYTTVPGSALLIPALAKPTGALNLPTSTPTSADRGVMMPKRRRTRAQDTARRINDERRLNDEFVAECNAPPPF